MPAGLSFVEAAAVGVNYVTALIGLDYAALRQGETLVVIGATGGVGGAACGIGAARGARVIAACRGAPPADAPLRHAGAEIVDIGTADLAAAIAELTGGKGADVIYDCVGRPDLTEAAIASLGMRGRLVVIAGTPGEQVKLELIPFYRRECRLIGVDSLKRSAAECAPMMEVLRPGFEAGTYPAPAIAAAYDLARGAEAYAEVARGTRGRIVLTMGEG
jgi:NADPH:quinone reductase-like Zn-dependent oxidoreductase